MSTAGSVVTAIQGKTGAFINEDSVVAGGLVRSISWDTQTLADGSTYQAGSLTPDVVLEERHDDQTVITENPVESGSMTSDHAYEQPSECEVCWVWSPSGGPLFSLRSRSFILEQYKKLLELKSKHVLLSVITGKRSYLDMLIQGISEVTDEKTENLLSVRIFLRQIIYTRTQAVSVIGSAANQKFPERTSPTVNGGTVSLQPASNFNTGK